MKSNLKINDFFEKDEKEEEINFIFMMCVSG